MYSPCYQCQKRRLHCHSICEEYGAYRQLMDEADKKKKAILEIEAMENYRYLRTGSV